MLTVSILLSACGNADMQKAQNETDAVTEGKSTETKEIDSAELEYKTITTAPGEIIDYETVFVEMPGEFGRESSKPGTIERVEYTTDVYENGVIYEKHANVYLPYGYDPEDKETKYNVLYYQHGNTGTQDFLTRGTPKNMLDNIFALGGVEPVIVVFISYYMTEEHLTESLAGDNTQSGLPANYYREVIEDIIPAVEGKYNTYTEDTSLEGLKESRSHRAFSGYSRGSVCTWYMFRNAMEYFEWYSPMSANAMDDDHNNGTDDEAIFNALAASVDANPDLDYFIYVCSGGANDATALRVQMKYFTSRTDYFSYGTDPETNNIYYSVSEFGHSDLYALYYFYNILQVFFK